MRQSRILVYLFVLAVVVLFPNWAGACYDSDEGPLVCL